MRERKAGRRQHEHPRSLALGRMSCTDAPASALNCHAPARLVVLVAAAGRGDRRVHDPVAVLLTVAVSAATGLLLGGCNECSVREVRGHRCANSDQESQNPAKMRAAKRQPTLTLGANYKRADLLHDERRHRGPHPRVHREDERHLREGGRGELPGGEKLGGSEGGEKQRKGAKRWKRGRRRLLLYTSLLNSTLRQPRLACGRCLRLARRVGGTRVC